MFVGNEREQAGLHRLDWQSFALLYELVGDLNWRGRHITPSTDKDAGNATL